MRRIAILALAAACALGASVPATAGPLRHRARALYAEGRAKLGPEAVGRNIVRDGYRTKAGVRKPRKHELRSFIATIDRRLHPPVLKPMRTLKVKPVSYTTPAPAATASGGGGAGGGLSSIRACESGGNYSTNTGNGFYGAYQFDASTWRAAGGSTATADQASPAEQDRVAAHWIASGHRGAWPNC